MYQDVPVRSSCVISAAMRPADTSIQSQRSALVEGGHAKNSLLVEHDLINDLRIDLHLQRELFVFGTMASGSRFSICVYIFFQVCVLHRTFMMQPLMRRDVPESSAMPE